MNEESPLLLTKAFSGHHLEEKPSFISGGFQSFWPVLATHGCKRRDTTPARPASTVIQGCFYSTIYNAISPVNCSVITDRDQQMVNK